MKEYQSLSHPKILSWTGLYSGSECSDGMVRRMLRAAVQVVARSPIR
jgi:hypothetical protein